MRLFLLFIIGWTFSLNLQAKDFSVTLNKKKDSLVVSGKTISLGMPKDMTVEGEIKVYNDGNFSIVLVGLTDMEAATTLVFAVNSSGKVLWKKDLEAFNPSTPLIEKDHVYLAVLGKTLKIKRKTGKVVWKHDGLYEKENVQFNGAGEITRKGSMIQFANNLEINDKTGKIAEVLK